MRWALGVMLLTGCDAVFLGDEQPLCAGNGELGVGLLAHCLAELPSELRELSAGIDTDTDCNEVVVQRDLDATPVCLVTARRIVVGVQTSAVGSRPLVLFATDEIVIGGRLSVASNRAQPRPGAGADFAGCVGADGTSATAGQPTGTAGGGGAGGSFAALGGSGGSGAGGTVGGAALVDEKQGFVRGGCPGGTGGYGAFNYRANPGAGGASGGAIYLVAGRSIRVIDTIDASGGGGNGGRGGISTGGGGGGGGGSGGLIGLDAPTVTLEASAILVAKGGGGGGGGGSSLGRPGGNGADADAANVEASASGGLGGDFGGAGGAGGVADIGGEGVTGPTGGGAGGGGGGSTGTIVIFAREVIDRGAQIAPAVTGR